MKWKRASGVLTLSLVLAGCTAPDAISTTPLATPAVVETQLAASEIATIDDGIAWARGLDKTVDARELSAGIVAIGEVVPDLDIWFQTSNDIGRTLIDLNLDVLNAPDSAGTKVDDLNAVVDEIEAAIEHGPNP